MKIYTVTRDFFPSIVELFSKHGTVEVLPTNYRNIAGFSADLIVFTGGEDINPAAYRAEARNGYYNDHRDTWELKVFKDIGNGKLKTKKVLGICRGMQLINVGLGGSLHYDIFERFRTSHESPHDIQHVKRETALSFMKRVNSLHHQGLNVIGETVKAPYKVIAVEPQTKVPEIVMWGEGLLGVQFHPEFFSDDNATKWQFADTVKRWCVDEEKIIVEQDYRSLERKMHRYVDEPHERARIELSSIVHPTDEAVQRAIESMNSFATSLTYDWGSQDIQETTITSRGDTNG